MSYKQKSGFKKRKEAEAKAISDLSNRPGSAGLVVLGIRAIPDGPFALVGRSTEWVF